MTNPASFKASRSLLIPLGRRLQKSNMALTLIAAGIGAITGVIVTILSLTAQGLHALNFSIALDVHLSAQDHITAWRALLFPTIGGGLMGALMVWRKRWSMHTSIDPVEANALKGGRMSLRDSLLVGLETLIANGFGASVGLEGGYSQVGAGLASRIGLWLHLGRKDLRIFVGCGSAGAIAAAFGAPLTGAFYAFELIIGSYSLANAPMVMAASVTGFLAAKSLIGSPYSLSVGFLNPVHPLHYLILLGLGFLACGLGIVTLRALPLFEKIFHKTRVPFYARPALGGFLVGGLALLTPQVLAAGRGAMSLDIAAKILGGQLLLLIGLKLLAALISLGSGFRGGLLFASLFVGALLGKLFGLLVGLSLPHLGLDVNACAVTGMGVFAVAVVGGPLTMSFLVLETTGDYSLTAAVLLACMVTSLVVQEAFGYSLATWRLHLRGETIYSAHDIGWKRNLIVAQMAKKTFAKYLAGASLAEFRKAYPLAGEPSLEEERAFGEQVIVLVDHQGVYCGLVKTARAHAPQYDDGAGTRPVSDLAEDADIVLLPEFDAEKALSFFDQAKAGRLCVIDHPKSRKAIGTLDAASLSRRYAEELEKSIKP